jgi:hypothetical protein
LICAQVFFHPAEHAGWKSSFGENKSIMDKHNNKQLLQEFDSEAVELKGFKDWFTEIKITTSPTQSEHPENLDPGSGVCDGEAGCLYCCS